jgi:hypothetical protein
MSKYFVIASFLISLLSLGISIVCGVDTRDEIQCSVNYMDDN